MSITQIGREGEELARIVLKQLKIDNLFQADWIIEKDGKYYVVEVKHKERFTAPPFDGHGLDLRQVISRQKFYQQTGIRCLFLVFDFSGAIYWAWLDELEKTEYHDTRNKIRVYNIKYFQKLGNFSNKKQGDTH